MDSGADEVAVEEMRFIAVTGAADDEYILARFDAAFGQSLEHAAREQVILRIDPGVLSLVRRKHLRGDLIPFGFLKTAGIDNLDNIELRPDRALETCDAVVAGRPSGGKADNQTFTAFDCLGLVARLQQQFAGGFSVQEVAHAGIRCPRATRCL